jgi:hypothetical protein
MLLVGKMNGIGVKIGGTRLLTGMWFNDDEAYGTMYLWPAEAFLLLLIY